MRILLLTVFSFIVACSSSSLTGQNQRVNQPEALEKPYVVLVSIDGYRYDYTDLYSPPAIKEFCQEGVSAKSLIPVYPSKTFTNHYSIVTGLYAENHGIVANQFYDPVKKARYSLSDPKAVQDSSWYGGEPLWVAAEKQGMLAASYFWPGSEAPIQGLRPTYFYHYNDSVPLEDRVSQVKKWLDFQEAERPHFITLYFSNVDSAGHKFGPNSVEVKNAVQRVDQAIAQLLKELKTFDKPLHIVFVSDHGMQKLDPSKVEYLDDYTDLESVRVEGNGPQVFLYIEDQQKLEKVYKDLYLKGKHFKVFKRNQIPTRLHYSKTPRVGDLLVSADAPYSVGLRNDHFKVSMGNHGYDPDLTSTMHGFFCAQGPNLKHHLEVKSFRNIHIYPMIIRLLGLKMVSEIDGDENVLNEIYRAAQIKSPDK